MGLSVWVFLQLDVGHILYRTYFLEDWSPRGWTTRVLPGVTDHILCRRSLLRDSPSGSLGTSSLIALTHNSPSQSMTIAYECQELLGRIKHFDDLGVKLAGLSRAEAKLYP